MKQGAFTFVLHSHLPYCRQAGRWPHGEEWIHEAASETYVPLLNALWDLRDEGVAFKATIGLTPVLVEQLRDRLVNQHFREYLRGRLTAAEGDMARHRAAGEGHRAYLAEFYRDFYAHALRSYVNRFGSDLVGAFRSLQDSGHVEIATSAATHGYLPLFDRDSTIAAQIGVGVHSYVSAFGRRPRAIWLPECAYRPGVERFLAEQGLGVFFSETHTVEGGSPVGKATGDAVGPYGEVPRRYVIPTSGEEPSAPGTTFEAYWVGGADVAVIARNNRTGLQVWSAEHGYPGEFSYREFHKKDGVSGLQYWRITGRQVDLADKATYQPAEAQGQVRSHARHFAALVEEQIADYQARTGRYGIVSAAYDTELFGHWWFEGVDWLREVLRLLAKSEVVDLTTASGFVEAHPPEGVLDLPESSWGQGGGHFTWRNVDTEWMWPLIHDAERRMEKLVARDARPGGARADVLRQAAREALLLQSSDWPFLVTTGQAKEYAIQRFREHLDRFERLAEALESSPTAQAEPFDGAQDRLVEAPRPSTGSGRAGESGRELAAELFERDNLFPDLDPGLFADRQVTPHPARLERRAS